MHISVWRPDCFNFSPKRISFTVIFPDSERCRMFKNKCEEFRPVGFFAHAGKKNSRPVFLHLDVGRVHIQRTFLHQKFCYKSNVFRDHVIEIAAQLYDLALLFFFGKHCTDTVCCFKRLFAHAISGFYNSKYRHLTKF